MQSEMDADTNQPWKLKKLFYKNINLQKSL